MFCPRHFLYIPALFLPCPIMILLQQFFLQFLYSPAFFLPYPIVILLLKFFACNFSIYCIALSNTRQLRIFLLFSKISSSPYPINILLRQFFLLISPFPSTLFLPCNLQIHTYPFNHYTITLPLLHNKTSFLPYSFPQKNTSSGFSPPLVPLHFFISFKTVVSYFRTFLHHFLILRV